MKYRICNHASMSRSSPSRIDPRLELAWQMGWTPNTNKQTPTAWRIPEPIHYNYAVRGPRAIDCPFIRNQIFYKKDGLWWSLYFVQPEQAGIFEPWIQSQDIDIYWFNSKMPRISEHQRLLWNTPCAELNDHERLFQMGYYADLRSKYFTDANDTILLDLLGPIRNRVLEDANLITGKFDELES